LPSSLPLNVRHTRLLDCEANSSKTGFYCIASSEYNSSYQACNAFKLAVGEWATASVTTIFWIKVYSPESIRVWRFVLTGRASNTERIYNWRFEGSTNNST